MTSMKSVEFLHPPSPLFLSVQMGRNWVRPPRPLTLKLRLATTSPPPPPHPHPTPTSSPFGILTAYQLCLVDISITYYARATHNSLQLKFNLY